MIDTEVIKVHYNAGQGRERDLFGVLSYHSSTHLTAMHASMDIGGPLLSGLYCCDDSIVCVVPGYCTAVCATEWYQAGITVTVRLNGFSHEG